MPDRGAMGPAGAPPSIPLGDAPRPPAQDPPGTVRPHLHDRQRGGRPDPPPSRPAWTGRHPSKPGPGPAGPHDDGDLWGCRPAGGIAGHHRQQAPPRPIVMTDASGPDRPAPPPSPPGRDPSLSCAGPCRDGCPGLRVPIHDRTRWHDPDGPLDRQGQGRLSPGPSCNGMGLLQHDGASPWPSWRTPEES